MKYILIILDYLSLIALGSYDFLRFSYVKFLKKKRACKIFLYSYNPFFYLKLHEDY